MTADRSSLTLADEEAPAVPEPGTLVLVGGGLRGAIAARRKSRLRPEQG